MFPSLNETCGTQNPLQQQCKNGIHHDQQNNALLARQPGSANGELYSVIAKNLADLKIKNMKSDRDGSQDETVKENSSGNKDCKKILTSDESCKKLNFSHGHHKFNMNFASSIQDFRYLHVYSSVDYAFSSFHPRTTEKGILEPSQIYDTVRYDYDSETSACLFANDGVSRHLPYTFGMTASDERIGTERTNNRPDAHTLPRKNIDGNISRKHVLQAEKAQQDSEGPFKISQNEQFSLLRSPQVTYNGLSTFENCPTGTLVRSGPRSYITEKQAVKDYIYAGLAHEAIMSSNRYGTVPMPPETAEGISLQRRNASVDKRLASSRSHWCREVTAVDGEAPREEYAPNGRMNLGKEANSVISKPPDEAGSADDCV